MEYNEKLYFGIGKHKNSYKQIIENPNVEICTANADNGLRISGVEFDNWKTMAKAFETMPMLKKIYNEESGLTLGNFC